MTPEQREELKQAALKATPGPWDFDTAETPYKIAGGEVVGGDALPWGAVYTTAEYETPDGTESLVVASEIGCDNGRFVARANPAAILSLIAQVEALTVPPGYRIVPIEPTPEMFEAAGASLYGYSRANAIEWAKEDKFESQADSGCDAYRAMLDAAPTIPAIPGTKEGA